MYAAKKVNLSAFVEVRDFQRVKIALDIAAAALVLMLLTLLNVILQVHHSSPGSAVSPTAGRLRLLQRSL
jgi:hypothetical protein